MNELLQTLAVAVIVVLAAGHTVLRLLPERRQRAQALLSAWLLRPGHARALRRLGLWLLPKAAAAGCGSGGGCASCRQCGSGSSERLPSAEGAPRSR